MLETEEDTEWKKDEREIERVGAWKKDKTQNNSYLFNLLRHIKEERPDNYM